MKKEVFICDLASCKCEIKNLEFMFKIKQNSAIGFNNDLIEFRGVDLRRGEDDLHFCTLTHLLVYLEENLQSELIKSMKAVKSLKEQNEQEAMPK